MFTDAAASGDYRDVDQIEIPEPAQFRIALNGNEKRRTQLYGICHTRRSGGFVSSINGVRDVFGALNLGTQKIEQVIGLTVDAAGELDLLDHLIGGMVKLLLGRNNAEQVDDKGQQQNGNEDEDQRTEIVGLTPLVVQHLSGFLKENRNHHLF